jgi:hypothetical protein
MCVIIGNVICCLSVFFVPKLAIFIKIKLEMRPTASPQQSGQSDMFNRRLDNFLYETHEIIPLAHYVDWNLFDRQYDSQTQRRQRKY